MIYGMRAAPSYRGSFLVRDCDDDDDISEIDARGIRSDARARRKSEGNLSAAIAQRTLAAFDREALRLRESSQFPLSEFNVKLEAITQADIARLCNEH